MKIILSPMPQPMDGACIGTLDGERLTLRFGEWIAGGLGWDEPRKYEYSDIAVALVKAVDRAAKDIFGSEWDKSLAYLMQLDPPSTSVLKIAEDCLPEFVLLFLARAQAHTHPRALGYALLCREALRSEPASDVADSTSINRTDKEGGNEASIKIMEEANRLFYTTMFDRDLFQSKNRKII